MSSHVAAPVSMKRWNGFVNHFKKEADTLKSIRQNGETQRKRSNSTFNQISKQTFRSIYGSTRKPVSETSSQIPYVSNKKISSQPTSREPTAGIMDFDYPPCNLHVWNPRKSCASRILKPEKLNVYGIPKRKADVTVVEGALYDEEMLPII